MHELGTKRDHQLAETAKRHGAAYSLRIVLEARRASIPISLGFGLVQQETGFRNVFGHDPTIYVGAGEVTKTKYDGYKVERGHTRMQGVGPCQLTWWSYQDQADMLGGCWKPEHNIRVGFEIVAGLLHQHGYVTGIARYNGSGPAADQYSRTVRALTTAWHSRFE